MNVTFHPDARDDLDRVFDWIARENPRAAHEMVVRKAKVMQLAAPELAHMGRPGLVDGTRELIEWPYIIVYQVREDHDEIVIASIVHGAQDRSADEAY